MSKELSYFFLFIMGLTFVVISVPSLLFWDMFDLIGLLLKNILEIVGLIIMIYSTYKLIRHISNQ